MDIIGESTTECEGEDGDIDDNNESSSEGSLVMLPKHSCLSSFTSNPSSNVDYVDEIETEECDEENITAMLVKTESTVLESQAVAHCSRKSETSSQSKVSQGTQGMSDFVMKQSRPCMIPSILKSVSIQAAVVHCLAQVEVTQVYKNEQKVPIEAVYYFPIGNGAVTHFHVEVNVNTGESGNSDDRKIKGIIKVKEKLRLEQDKDENENVFIGEEIGTGIFKITTGSLAPGQEVKVIFGYVTEVKNDPTTDSIRFFIPTAVVPRHDCLKISEPFEPCRNSEELNYHVKDFIAPLSIKVVASIKGKFKSIVSPTHKSIHVNDRGPIPENPAWNKAVITLEANDKASTTMDRDFILLISPEEPLRPSLYHEKLENSVAVMAHFIPSLDLNEHKAELIFLIDQSESMKGDTIMMAKTAIKLFLHALPLDCYLNIIGFGASSQNFLFKEGSQRYGNETVAKALQFINKIQTNMGETEILYLLQKIYEQKLIPGYHRQIIILTDGTISDSEKVVGLAKLNSEISRVFLLGIGSVPSHAFIERMAYAGKGTCCYIENDETIQKETLNVLKNSLQPQLNDLKFESKENEHSEETCNSGLSVFDGTQVTITRVVKKETDMKVSGPLDLNLTISEENDLGSTEMLHRLVMIKKIRELEMEEASVNFSSLPKRTLEIERIKQEIVKIALKYGIATKYTHFLAPSQIGGLKNSSNKQRRIIVCSQLPKNYSVPFSVDADQLMLSNPLSSIVTKLLPRKRKCCRYTKQRLDSTASSKSNNMRRNKVSLALIKRPRSSSYPSTSTTDDQLTLVNCQCGPSGRQVTKILPNHLEPNRPKARFRDEGEPMDTSSMEDIFAINSSSSACMENLLKNLSSLQSLQGFFALNPALANLLSIDLQRLRTEFQNHSFDESAFATALTINFCMKKLQACQELWDAVVVKAQKWILQNHPQNAEQIIAAAGLMFNKI